MSIVLQPRDLLLVDALVRAVRVMLLTQIAAFWRADISNTRKRMKRLEQAGFVTELILFAEPVPHIQPLCSWSSGPLPNPGPISYQAKERYRKGPAAKQMKAYVASRRTLRQFNVGSKTIKAHQATHDIGLSAVFIHGIRAGLWTQSEFIGEDVFPADTHKRWGMKVVDVLICHERDIDRPYLAVDYICKYSCERVRELSMFLAEKNLPFAFF